MEVAIGLITGSFGALIMVAAALLALFTSVIITPVCIMQDDKTIMDSRAVNIAYGIGTFLFFPLALGYCFFHFKAVKKPILITLGGLIIAVAMFLLRGFLAVFFA